MLDLGCVYGLSLQQMRNLGFSVTGVEQVPSAIQYILSTVKVPVFQGDAEGFLNSNANKHDVISLLNVLEHVKNPKGLLTKVASALNADGLLVVCVPDAQVQLYLGRLRNMLCIRY